MSNFTNNDFKGNFADHDGGGVKWIGHEPYNLLSKNSFFNNTAMYGNEIASVPSNLKMIDSVNHRILNDINPKLENIASG